MNKITQIISELHEFFLNLKMSYNQHLSKKRKENHNINIFLGDYSCPLLITILLSRMNTICTSNTYIVLLVLECYIIQKQCYMLFVSTQHFDCGNNLQCYMQLCSIAMYTIFCGVIIQNLCILPLVDNCELCCVYFFSNYKQYCSKHFLHIIW